LESGAEDFRVVGRRGWRNRKLRRERDGGEWTLERKDFRVDEGTGGKF
jgi:hypothetical protein